LFKPSDLEHWDDTDVNREEQDMLKELSRLMLNAATTNKTSFDDNNNAIKHMTHKRQATLRKIVDVTSTSQCNTDINQDDESKNHNKISMTFLNISGSAENDSEDVDHDIFKYVPHFLDTTEDTTKTTPKTSSVSLAMNNLAKDGNNDDDTFTVDTNGCLPEMMIIRDNIADNGDDNSDSKKLENNNNEEKELMLDNDTINTLKSGTTLLKYGRHGKPKFKLFQLTPDQKYLIWHSEKKDIYQTSIALQDIQKILVANESNIVKKN